MNNVASLNNYVILNEHNSFGYTYDIYSCLALLIHRKNSIVISHIESYVKDGMINTNQLNDIIILNDDSISFVEIFIGTKTNNHNLEKICNILKNNNIPYKIYEAFMDLYLKGSIGYDYNRKKYYMLDSDYEIKEVTSLKLIR